MTALVIQNVFTHEHNPLEVARQEYDLAKEHFRQVVLNRVIGIPGHERRFRDALDRKIAARDRFVEMLTRK